MDVSRGLVNGSLGYVTRMDKNDIGKVVSIYVKFDDMEEEVKIEPFTVTYKIGKRANVHRSRKQFPLVVAYGITVHKSQGVSRENVLAKLDEAFAPGMEYYFLTNYIYNIYVLVMWGLVV